MASHAGPRSARLLSPGGIPELVRCVADGGVNLQVEAIAALANLAVDDAAERLIADAGGISPVVTAATRSSDAELLAQVARCLRNLSVAPPNKALIRDAGGVQLLTRLQAHASQRVAGQATKALLNLAAEVPVAEPPPVTTTTPAPAASVA